MKRYETLKEHWIRTAKYEHLRLSVVIWAKTKNYPIRVEKRNMFGGYNGFEELRVMVADKQYLSQILGYRECRRHVIRSVKVWPDFISIEIMIVRPT